MIDILSVENMRKSDAHTISSGTPGRELMMRAAKAVFDAAQWDSPVAIVCGSGNNAGDGYALALLLHESGKDCTIFRTSEKFSADGGYYHDLCEKEQIPSLYVPGGEGMDLGGFRTIVDCLLGTGFSGDVRDDLAAVIEKINESGAKKISVDINSGLNGDSGMAETCVRSDLTVSVGGFKPGHFLGMAKDVMASKRNADIGIKPIDEPYRLIEAEDVSAFLGSRPNFSNKGTYGYTALIGGSTRYSGAIRLAYLANAAMRSGAGVVKVALPSSLVHDVAPHILESTLFPLSENDLGEKKVESSLAFVREEIDELIANVRTVAFGMGIGTGNGAAQILEYLLKNYSGCLIVDADGLTLLSKIDRSGLKKSSCSLVLTPHVKEMSRLTGLEIDEINADPIGTAKRYANDTGAVVLLKGPSTVVTDGESVFIVDRGCSGMATAGSGDVLSGVMAAVCCVKPSGNETAHFCLAAACAAFINGAAGELAEAGTGSFSMIASDTISHIPQVLKYELGK